MQVFYISVEFPLRELGPKLYLTDKIREFHNFKFILGESDNLLDAIFRGKLEPGFILLKSIQYYTKKKLYLLRKLGFIILYLEEESWVPFDDADLIRRRAPSDTLDLVNFILAPSTYFYNLLLFTKRPLYNLGHPRVDYIRDTRSNLQHNFKFDFLIISSFGFVKNINKNVDFYRTMELEVGKKKYSECSKTYVSYFDAIKRDFSVAFKLYNELKSMGFTVRYRPHPSEELPNDIDISNINLSIVEDASSYRHIVHFGSTGAFDLISSGKDNVYSYISKDSNHILKNSRYINKIFYNVEMLLSVTNKKIKCLSNLDYYYSAINHAELKRLVEDIKYLKFNSNRVNYINIFYILYRYFKKNKSNYHKGNLLGNMLLYKNYKFNIIDNKFIEIL